MSEIEKYIAKGGYEIDLGDGTEPLKIILTVEDRLKLADMKGKAPREIMVGSLEIMKSILKRGPFSKASDEQIDTFVNLYYERFMEQLTLRITGYTDEEFEQKKTKLLEKEDQ